MVAIYDPKSPEIPNILRVDGISFSKDEDSLILRSIDAVVKPDFSRILG